MLLALVLELFGELLDAGFGGLALDAQNGFQKRRVFGLRRELDPGFVVGVFERGDRLGKLSQRFARLSRVLSWTP